ncbi:DUF6318 family protein [Arthrobacter cupressi]
MKPSRFCSMSPTRHNLSRRGARSVLFSSAALTALLASGCQRGEAPTPVQTVTAVSAPTPTAAPGPSYKQASANGKALNVPVPVMPPIAKQNSKQGLEAFTKYWYSTYTYAVQTGDLKLWLESQDLPKDQATDYQKAMDRNFAKGRWTVGGRALVQAVDVKWVKQPVEPQQVFVRVNEEAISYYAAPSKTWQASIPATKQTEVLLTTFVDGQWRINAHGIVSG